MNQIASRAGRFGIAVAVLFLFGGCSAPAPTFTEDIAPIVFRNCAPCHRPEQVAPFSLLTYEDVAGRARMVAEVTKRRYMPPWQAEVGYGSFAGERRLTDEQIALTLGLGDARYTGGATFSPPTHPPVSVGMATGGTGCGPGT